jgi:hypothetical protein
MLSFARVAVWECLQVLMQTTCLGDEAFETITQFWISGIKEMNGIEDSLAAENAPAWKKKIIEGRASSMNAPSDSTSPQEKSGGNPFANAWSQVPDTWKTAAMAGAAAAGAGGLLYAVKTARDKLASSGHETPQLQERLAEAMHADDPLGSAAQVLMESALPSTDKMNLLHAAQGGAHPRQAHHGQASALLGPTASPQPATTHVVHHVGPSEYPAPHPFGGSPYGLPPWYHQGGPVILPHLQGAQVVLPHYGGHGITQPFVGQGAPALRGTRHHTALRWPGRSGGPPASRGTRHHTALRWPGRSGGLPALRGTSRHTALRWPGCSTGRSTPLRADAGSAGVSPCSRADGIRPENGHGFGRRRNGPGTAHGARDRGGWGGSCDGDAPG